MNVPNFISLARICCVPIIVWLILKNDLSLAFWVTIAAAISDALDGIIAKQFHCETNLGAFLDPIADKALLVCLFIALGYQGHIDMWLVILVVFRDLLIIGGALMFHTLTHSLTMAPLMISKVNTVAQFVLAVGTLGIAAFQLNIGAVLPVLVWGVALTTVWSGTAYVYLWSRKADAYEREDMGNDQVGGE